MSIYDVTEADEIEWTQEESVGIARHMLEYNQTYETAIIETKSVMPLNKEYVMELYNEMLNDYIIQIQFKINSRKDGLRNISSWTEEEWNLMFRVSKGTGQKEYYDEYKKNIEELEWILKLYNGLAYKYNDLIHCKECAKEFITGKNYEQHHKSLTPLYIWQLIDGVLCHKCKLNIVQDWYSKD